METPFWRLIVEAINDSQEFLQEQENSEDLDDLPPEQYKFFSKILKAKKKYLETLADTPKNLISWLGKPENERKEFDPYDIQWQLITIK